MKAEKLKAFIIFLCEGKGVGEIENLEILNECNVRIDNDEEYTIYTEEEANEAFQEDEEELFDEMGIELFCEWVRDYILENFVESDWFDDYMKDYYETYIEDIREEDNRLEEEMENCDVITEEDFIQKLCSNYSNGIQWYIAEFGIKDFSTMVKENDLIKFVEVVEWVKDTDGRGHLASYDGVENEQDDYFIYRIN